MENPGSSRRKAIQEVLIRGHECAKKLTSAIHESCEDGSETPFIAEQLAKEVLMSFTNSLLFLNNPTSESHDVSNFHVSDSPKSEDSQESNYKSITVKERRGCYKRRRNEQTRETESEEAPIDDGHQWRKYGQKEILNAKYPRNYYRCTHKFDQGCQATKQVQRVQEDPIIFKTSYFGHHTCKNLVNSEIILDPMSPSASSKFLSFDNSFPTPSNQECPFFSSSFPSSSVKLECKDELPPSTYSNDYLISSDLTFDSSPRHVTLSSTLDSEYTSVDILDVLYDPARFDDVFQPFLEFR